MHDLQIFPANDALVHVARIRRLRCCLLSGWRLLLFAADAPVRSNSFKLRLLSNSILWLHLLLLNLKLLLLLQLHLLLLHQRLLLLLPTTQRSFAISSDEFHLRLSQAAGRRWSLRWLVKHRRLQLLWYCRVIVIPLNYR